jgi:hypothetical protein
LPGVYHACLSTLSKGDISTLQIWGHFYFALTGAEIPSKRQPP